MEKEEGIELSTPTGWRARLIGIDTKIILLVVLIAGIFYIATEAYKQNQAVDAITKATMLAQHKVTHDLLATVIVNQGMLIAAIHDTQRQNSDGTAEVVYMLSLSQQQRDALKLIMPLTLRHKLTDGKIDNGEIR
jgi:hypothetical protein